MALSLRQLDAFFQDEDTYGQLCDIIVPDAAVQGWAAVLRMIDEFYPYEFQLNGKPARIPMDPLPLLVWTDDCPPFDDMLFRVNNLRMRVLFTFESRIEIDTFRSLVRREHYKPLQDLMRRMGAAAQRDVFMTAEGASANESVLRYDARNNRFLAPNIPGTPRPPR